MFWSCGESHNLRTPPFLVEYYTPRLNLLSERDNNRVMNNQKLQKTKHQKHSMKNRAKHKTQSNVNPVTPANEGVSLG